MARDPRIDAYIARQADFARPILTRLREAVNAACPECEEGLKWSMPAFLYKGQILCQMAAFKAHATFGFWRGKEVTGGTGKEREAMGSFGRIESVDDLPDEETLASLVRRAVAVADSGARAPAPPKHPKAEIEMPDDFRTALEANPKAAATLQGFPPSARRDYLQWVVESKRAETRAKRIAQSVAWLADGKRRHWKYQDC